MVAGRSSFVSITALALAGVLLSACSLAASAPAGQAGSMDAAAAAQPTPIAQKQPTVELPMRKPAATKGAASYQQKCVSCHGTQGRGDGEMASDLTSDATARAQTPEVWYLQITNGNSQSGMPPFADSLDVNQRWDVIAYAWTLAAPSAQIARGQAVYTKQCVQCHGETGKGDGPDALRKLPDFSRFATFANIEAGRLDQALASTHIPSFAGTTSESERRAAIDYIRTFAYDPASEGIVVQGYLVNGTAGQSVPGNLPITFYIFPGGAGQNAITQTLQSDAQGRFVVTTTNVAPGDLVAATTEYKRLNFFSDLADYAPQVTIPITLYEHTADAVNVSIGMLHIVAVPGANGLEVSEIYVLSNAGDKIVAGFGQPVMRLGLPDSAIQVTPDTDMPPDVLTQIDGGLDYYDAIPVGANAGQLIFQYTVPNGPYQLDRPLMQKVTSVNLLVEGADTPLTVSGAQFTSAGTQTIQGQTYQQFRASNLEAGQTLALTITAPGAPFDYRILVGIALVVVGIVGVVLWQRSREPGMAVDSPETQRDLLIDQIAALDDDFAAGGLDEANYTAKRARLKERLLKLM
jgi:mono/diheme cytochrome c family protein